MDRYQDLRLLPDPEFPPSVLLNALFAKLHRVLVELPEGRPGISFPGYDAAQPTLGDRLRLHGSGHVLAVLADREWLRGMRDHLDIGTIAPVPATDRSVLVRRVQAKSNPERLRRRLMRRHGLSREAALVRQPTREGERLVLPWLEVRSTSTGQRFRLFVDQQVHPGPPTAGVFSPYGLSATASLPWF
ncbi:type I-F CRISPR-associated endoribonuclease Cas6/Csy4 [Thiococcus pfennigii]|uniref:type I-F CRISPR-associated endoribonuclease Cas6/Csy4 n=1 Tax=Thiococcus pfennigii TaxID=1057 RepID=UPI00190775FA|nr:type I-F CRISPR-associated endoribonuclease Cas6/Csy4 [Thiococcus pfennigii]MBK1733374.1 type I-F CRISPR-associated endoribonuclease Cas6/Csy4 [Thiococcus pfennigii]